MLRDFLSSGSMCACFWSCCIVSRVKGKRWRKRHQWEFLMMNDGGEGLCAEP